MVLQSRIQRTDGVQQISIPDTFLCSDLRGFCVDQLFLYADSSGAVSIIGPAMAEQVVESFTYEFIKKAEALIGEDAVLLLCPRTTLALIGTDKAAFADVALPGPMRYGEACAWMIGKEKILGQMCIKNINYTLQNGICKAVRLK